MFDCSEDVEAFHDEEVNLPSNQRTEMRKRRDANRDRIVAGLKAAGRPIPLEFRSQGSYAMWLMIQAPNNDYDIDDGIYFKKEDLVRNDGTEMTPWEVREMVREAVDDGSFKTPPKTKENCVRVVYEAGYHVDLPIYRRVVERDAFGNETTYYERASSTWLRSDARDVTKWYREQNKVMSPAGDDDGQMRRVNREIKKFARSRADWKGKTACGFMISKLVTECYMPWAGREDRALRDTMQAIRDRLKENLVVLHPTTPGETISDGLSDSTAAFLRDRLTEAIDTLSVLLSPSCTRDKALRAWDQVFNTDFFSKRGESSKRAAGIANAGILSGYSAPPAVDKRGGGTYA